jgi:hypothetical protein
VTYTLASHWRSSAAILSADIENLIDAEIRRHREPSRKSRVQISSQFHASFMTGAPADAIFASSLITPQQSGNIERST